MTGLPDPSFWDDPNPPANKDDNEVRLRNGVVYIMDTQKLFNASGLPEAKRQIGLENALKALGIPARNLHNAGNDACCGFKFHFSVCSSSACLLIKSLCGSDTLALYDALVGEGVMKQELIAENANRLAKIKPKGKQGWYSGWE